MKVIVHYPSDEKAKEELKKRAAEVHSDSVIAYIKKAAVDGRTKACNA